MLEEFRKRYPQGNFLRKLVHHREGYYLVTVTLIANDRLQAVGSASAPTATVAEAEAIEKAMLRLELEQNYQLDSQRNATPVKPLPKIINKPAVFQTPGELIESFDNILETDASNPISEDQVETKDFIEIMLEIDRQIKRLGWTTKRRHNYLRKKYGKRSQHSLKDWELLDFLAFLQNQADL